jgi:hypothetical protein
MRFLGYLPARAERDPASIASVLRWVCAQHQARLDQDGLDVAVSTASALGATRQEITQALRGES